ncbi:MAG TPA: Crp/Fnr family transcriptional regulator [Phnomibacter sp.]|nr:Crp/Fnr family transcriptional regulator [Phnomibacter sp.]
MSDDTAIEHAINYLQGIYRLQEDALHELRALCMPGKVSKGHDLQPIGHTCRTIYINVKGLLRIYYLKDGIDVTESFEKENAVVARVESLFSGRASRKGIQAVEDTQYIAISASPLFELYDKFPALERLFRKIFEAGYVRTVNRLESIQFHSAEERYRHLMAEEPELLQRVPLKHIASYLGMTQVSLSRIRAQR